MEDLESEKEAVIDWFIKHNVPSISPQTSVHLLHLYEEVSKAIFHDNTTPKSIKAYAVALHMVATAGHIQQGVIIARLERAIKGVKD